MAGTLVNLTRVAETIQGFQITSYADMATALNYIGGLTGFQYSGNINMINVNGTLTWQLQLNNQTNNSSSLALVNDIIIIENNALVSVCKEANFSSLYTVSS